jgi:hypothetical protein
MRRPDFVADNPCTDAKEEIIWKKRDDAPGKGIRARNYAIVVPAAYNEGIATVIEQYLNDRYSIDGVAWLTITTSIKLEPHFRDSAWWRSPKGHTIPEQVCQYSPHMYIWMMGARYVEGVAPAYTTPWDTLALLQPDQEDYFPLDGAVPPKELIRTATDAVQDMKAFHGNRLWNISLARMTDSNSGPGWRMPTLLELVRTHPKLPGMSVPQLTNWPFYYITYYLSHTRQEPGYYKSAAFNRFTTEGTWDIAKIPYHLIPLYMTEGDDDDLFSTREHSYTTSEFYWVLVQHFHIKPELAYEFIAFAAAVAGPDELHLRKLLRAFEDDRLKDPDTARYFEQHPPEADCLPAMLGSSSPTATRPFTSTDLEPWRERCWEEEATASMRHIVKASYYPGASLPQDDDDDILSTPTSLPLVQVDGPMFDLAYFTDPNANLGYLLPLAQVKPAQRRYYSHTSQVEAATPLKVVSRGKWPAEGDETDPEEKAAAQKRADNTKLYTRLIDAQDQEAVTLPYLLAGQQGKASPWLATCVEKNAARDTGTPQPTAFPEYVPSGEPEVPPAKPNYAPSIAASSTWTLDTHPVDKPINTWPDEDKKALINLVTKENEETIAARNPGAFQAKPTSEDSLNLQYDVFKDMGKRWITEPLIVAKNVAAQIASHNKTNQLALVNRPDDTEVGILAILHQRRSRALAAASQTKAEVASQPVKPKAIFPNLKLRRTAPNAALLQALGSATKRQAEEPIETPVIPPTKKSKQDVLEAEPAPPAVDKRQVRATSPTAPEIVENRGKAVADTQTQPSSDFPTNSGEAVAQDTVSIQGTNTDQGGESTQPGEDSKTTKKLAKRLPQNDLITDPQTRTELQEFIKQQRQAATATTATGTPPVPPGQDHPYRLWTVADEGRSPTLTYGGKLPNLDDDTPLYDCMCDLESTDRASDPPPMVHLADKQIQRLYWMVSTGKRALEHLSDTWPHVFNSKGAIYAHRLPQGEPALICLLRADRPLFAVAHKNCILMGGAAYRHFGNHLLTMPKQKSGKKQVGWTTTGYIKSLPTPPNLLSRLEDGVILNYPYKTKYHTFAYELDPRRLPQPAVNAILNAADKQRDQLYLRDAALTINVLIGQYNLVLPQPEDFRDFNLSPDEASRDHWGISHFTLRQRYIQMAKSNVPFQKEPKPESAGDESRHVDRILNDSRTLAGLIHSSQSLFADFLRLAASAKDLRANAEQQVQQAALLERQSDEAFDKARALGPIINKHKLSYNSSLQLLRDAGSLDLQVVAYDTHTLDATGRDNWLQSMDEILKDDLPQFIIHNTGSEEVVEYQLKGVKVEDEQEEAVESEEEEEVDSDVSFDLEEDNTLLTLPTDILSGPQADQTGNEQAQQQDLPDDNED